MAAPAYEPTAEKPLRNSLSAISPADDAASHPSCGVPQPIRQLAPPKSRRSCRVTFTWANPVQQVVDRKSRVCAAARKDEAFSAVASLQRFDPYAGA